MGRFTLEQRWEILKSYYQSECCVAETVRNLRKIFGRNEAPSAPGVRKFIKKVRETGMLVDNKYYPRIRAVCTDERIAAVAQSVCENPKISIRRRAQQLNISRTSLRRILQKELGHKKQSLEKNNIVDSDEGEEVVNACVLEASLSAIECSQVFGAKQGESKSVEKEI